MKSLARAFFLILLISLVFGCGEKAGIEGKVVDGKGNPMGGIKLIAKQVQPIKGYEHFETTTDSDGTFKFKGVFPSSDYVISPWADAWKTEAKTKVQSGPEGQTSMLDKPFMVRYTISKDGVIKDSKTGLEWAPAPAQSMNWFQADSYARGLRLAGGGWILPTRAELRGIYDKSTESGADPAFHVDSAVVWTSEFESHNANRDFSTVCLFNFKNVPTHEQSMFASYDFRVLAVRSRK